MSTWQTGGPHLKARVLHAPEIVETGIELEVLQRQLRDTVFEVLAMAPEFFKRGRRDDIRASAIRCNWHT